MRYDYSEKTNKQGEKSMKTTISVPISTDQFLELANFLHSNNDPRDPVDMVTFAIDYWLLKASLDPNNG